MEQAIPERDHGAKHGDRPHEPTWKLNVQGVVIESARPTIVVRDAIKLAGFDPDADWIMVLKVSGQPKKPVELTTVIDLRTPGVEKLRLTPKKIDNGEAPVSRRVDFALLPEDEAHLNRLGLRWETVIDGNRRWLLIRSYPLPPSFSNSTVDIAIEIPASYPGAQLDMFYCHPHLALAGGGAIAQTQHVESISGVGFQRWSRHRAWDSAHDTLATHLALVDEFIPPRSRTVITRRRTLVLQRPLHRRLRDHLFPGDGLEAAALVLCSPVMGRRQKLLASDLVLVPHQACSRRTSAELTWPGEFVEMAIDRATAQGLTIIAAHSHPGGMFEFSACDDGSDRVLLPALFHGVEQDAGSAIMVPSGAMRARLYGRNGEVVPFGLVMCPGDDISVWWDADATPRGPADPPVAFTSAMTNWLRRLSVCVIGVSGTGSIVAEQLARLGFGEIILIDPDKVEARNLDRILNSTNADVAREALKVEMFGHAIRRYRPDTALHCICIPMSIATRDAVLAAIEADVIFSCVDTAEGRHIADRIAACFAIPLLDVGVSIPTRRTTAGDCRIAEVCGRIDYVQPGGSTLADRGVYDAEMLELEYLARAAPDAYRQKIADGYLRGILEQAPAVISLNMRAASACVMEFIARTFPFRHEPNHRYARTVFMLADGEEEFLAEDEFSQLGQLPIASGLQEPLLGLPALSTRRRNSMKRAPLWWRGFSRHWPRVGPCASSKATRYQPICRAEASYSFVMRAKIGALAYAARADAASGLR